MRKVTWRDDVKTMSFDEFAKAHAILFAEDSEMREAYREATGREASKKTQPNKETEPKEESPE